MAFVSLSLTPGLLSHWGWDAGQKVLEELRTDIDQRSGVCVVAQVINRTSVTGYDLVSS